MFRNFLFILLGFAIALCIVFHEPLRRWVTGETRAAEEYIHRESSKDDQPPKTSSSTNFNLVRAVEQKPTNGELTSLKYSQESTDSLPRTYRAKLSSMKDLVHNATRILRRDVMKEIDKATLNSQVHIVKRGESLLRIAGQHSLDAKMLARWNATPFNKTLRAGDTLRIFDDGSLSADRKVLRHIVRRGETLGGIALQYGVPTRILRRVNGQRGDRIVEGQILIVDSWIFVKAKSGTTLSHIAAKFKIPVSRLIASNSIQNPDDIPVGSVIKVNLQ